MSFHSAAPLAQSLGVNITGLVPGNPADEAVATQVLMGAMPSSLGEGYECLVRIAEELKGQPDPVDECLHCRLEKLYPEEQAAEVLANMRRVGMFDVPRRLFATQHGLWVYWLYAGVFVLSPTEAVDLGWAFQRHAYRLQWRLTGKQPETEMPVAEARDYVRQHLLVTASEGLERLRADYHCEVDEGVPMPDIPVKGPLFEPVTAWFGSLTGSELLREKLGRDQRLIGYNCCKASTDLTASQVRQLQNQDVNSIDC